MAEQATQELILHIPSDRLASLFTQLVIAGRVIESNIKGLQEELLGKKNGSDEAKALAELLGTNMFLQADNQELTEYLKPHL